MGLRRIIAERDFRRVVAPVQYYIDLWSEAAQDYWRGWHEQDVVRLGQRLYDPAAYSGGILKLTAGEWRALPKHNRRVAAKSKQAALHPFLAWVEGRGLLQLRKAA